MNLVKEKAIKKETNKAAAASTKKSRQMKKEVNNRGAWTAEEDKKLDEAVNIHGAKRWKIIAAKSGLNRCGKSCRLRWLNYLRPSIKRGNISEQEVDLIIRLHKLLGNRWSLIAGRLPGRTDNEIKNYWNSHLSKKIKHKEKKQSVVAGGFKIDGNQEEHNKATSSETIKPIGDDDGGGGDGDGDGDGEDLKFSVDDFFEFPNNEDPLTLEWVSKFLEFDDSK